MRPEELAQGIQAILSRSPAFPDCKLVVDIIANPKAGGFKRLKFSRRRGSELQSVVDKAMALPERTSPLSVHLHLTERGGHAAAIMQRLLDRSESNGKDSRHLILTAGGDGTSLETAERLVHIPEPKKDSFALLRLPLGTGNDGSEGRDLVACLGRFLSGVKLERRPAVKIIPAAEGGTPPFYAFNIASVGLDAFVSDMTNKLKRSFPGDSYKFWVNVAVLFYEKMFRVLPMRMRLWDGDGNQVEDETSRKLFVAMGATGHRQYGSNKKILPGSENIAAVSNPGLLRKLMIKGLIESGQHEGLAEVRHYTASRMELEYHEDILLQCDGEAHALANCDFPLKMELVKDAYNVVVPV